MCPSRDDKSQGDTCDIPGTNSRQKDLQLRLTWPCSPPHWRDRGPLATGDAATCRPPVPTAVPTGCPLAPRGLGRGPVPRSRGLVLLPCLNPACRVRGGANPPHKSPKPLSAPGSCCANSWGADGQHLATCTLHPRVATTPLVCPPTPWAAAAAFRQTGPRAPNLQGLGAWSCCRVCQGQTQRSQQRLRGDGDSPTAAGHGRAPTPPCQARPEERSPQEGAEEHCPESLVLPVKPQFCTPRQNKLILSHC